jgi:hypothetical protein
MKVKKMDRGGVVDGPSHDDGGVKYKGDEGGLIELEGDEFVIPHEALRKKGIYSFKGTIQECLDTLTATLGVAQTNETVTEIHEGDAVINKRSFNDPHDYVFQGTIPEILTQMQKKHGGRPIKPVTIEDPEVFEKLEHGGTVTAEQALVAMPETHIVFADGGNIPVSDFQMPQKHIFKFALYIKNKYPSVWKKGGNEFGNQAFENLERVIKRGHWLEDERWMYNKWQSFMARHQHDYRLAGVVAMLKWVGTVNEGWDYMKKVIREAVKKDFPEMKSDPKLFREGGNVDEISGGLADKQTLRSIAKLHEVPYAHILHEYMKGVSIEKEHTDSEATAGEIARDHLFENADYYTSLEAAEGEDRIIMGINVSELSTYEHKDKVNFFLVSDVLREMPLDKTVLDSDIVINTEMIEEMGITSPVYLNYSVGSEKVWIDKQDTQIVLAAKESGLRFIPVIVRTTHASAPMYSEPTIPIAKTSNKTTYHSPSIIGFDGKSYKTFMYSIEKVLK